jgi:hypothetical protein
MDNSSKLKKSLLAATCISALSAGAAHAGVINESIVGDFNGSLLNAPQLPPTTTQVIGSVGGQDTVDSFTITGLTPGDVYFATPAIEGSLNQLFYYTSLSTDGGVPPDPIPNGEGEQFTVPADGNLTFGTGFFDGATANYSLTLRLLETPSNQVPVAPTAALLGIGAAAAGLRRRKHGKPD